MPYAELNSQRIYYEDTGGKGLPVVFCHGFFMDHEMWEPQVQALRSKYRCITWDERGWGQTEHSRTPFTYWDLAEDCCALLDRLDIGQAVLCGMSQGGFISLRVALADRERVLGLVLVDTDPHAETLEKKALFETMLQQAVSNGLDDELIQGITGILFGPGFDSSYWQGKMKARAPASVRSAVECMVTRDDVGHRLGEIRCPSLVIHGELDASFPVGDVETWADQLPGLVQFVRIPDAGHTSNLENPQVVNQRLLQFLCNLP